MTFILWAALVGVGLWTLVSLLLALAWLVGRRVLGHRPRWRRALWFTLATVPVHALVTVPATLGFLGSRLVRTRRDEAAYAGPHLSPQGEWLPQSRIGLAEDVAAHRVLGPTAPATEVHLVAADGTRLRAFCVPATQHLRPVDAVLVHGLFRGALELETVGRWLRDLGCDVLLLEMRNHGGSARASASFGPREALDVRAAAEWFDRRPGAEQRRVLLFGVSLGTVAVAIAAPEVARLRWLVLDAPVIEPLATARRMLAVGPKSQHGRIGLPGPLCSLTLLSLELWAGIDLGAIRPLEDLHRLSPDVRALVIGAGKDDRVPPADVEATWQAIPAAAEHKQLWIEAEAGHGTVWDTAPERYREELRRLLDG